MQHVASEPPSCSGVLLSKRVPTAASFPMWKGALQGQDLMQKKRNQINLHLAHSHRVYIHSTQWERLFYYKSPHFILKQGL